jgi:hypothetical protein
VFDPCGRQTNQVGFAGKKPGPAQGAPEPMLSESPA